MALFLNKVLKYVRRKFLSYRKRSLLNGLSFPKPSLDADTPSVNVYIR